MANENENTLSVPVQGIDSAKKFQTLGMIVTWSPANRPDVLREAVVAAFDSVGMAGFAPRERDLKESLRVALVGHFSRKNRRVAPAGRRGYEVLVETPQEETVTVETAHVLSAWIGHEKDAQGEDQKFVECDVTGFDLDGKQYTPQDVADWVESARKRIDGAVIGEKLVDVGTALHGVAIRDSGGAYWIPNGSVGRWLQLKEALEKAGGPVNMREWEAANTPRSIASTIDSVKALVDKRCDEMLGVVADPQKGERALDHQADDAVELVKQLEEYEEVLGTKLEELRAKVTEVQGASVRAAMAAHAAREEKLRDRRLAAQAQQ